MHIYVPESCGSKYSGMVIGIGMEKDGWTMIKKLGGE